MLSSQHLTRRRRGAGVDCAKIVVIYSVSRRIRWKSVEYYDASQQRETKREVEAARGWERSLVTGTLFYISNTKSSTTSIDPSEFTLIIIRYRRFLSLPFHLSLTLRRLQKSERFHPFHLMLLRNQQRLRQVTTYVHSSIPCEFEKHSELLSIT